MKGRTKASTTGSFTDGGERALETEKEKLVKAIEDAIGDEDIKYIIEEDILGFGEYMDILLGTNYVIRQFGNYYVALIF